MPKLKDLFSLLNETGFSAEQMGRRLGISGMTLRRWESLPESQPIPAVYLASLRELVYELVAEGALNFGSPSVQGLLKGDEGTQFKAALKALGFSNEFMSSAEPGSEAVIASLSQIGVQRNKQESVHKGRGRLPQFEKMGREWKSRIRTLVNVIKSDHLTVLDKSSAYGALFYLLTPFDFIPDHVPGVGLIDDFFILGLIAVYYLDKFPKLFNSTSTHDRNLTLTSEAPGKKMISWIVRKSIEKKMLVLCFAFVVILVGAISFKHLPIEAYPDVADTWVQVITQWPGHAAEEIERQITVPIEIAVSSVPHHTQVRSVSLFGLAVVTVVFDEKTTTFTARQYILERLNQVVMPTPSVQPTLGPMSSPVGQIYWYFLDSDKRDSMELKEFQDWELEKRLREVDGVAEVSSFGGQIKQFQALLSPVALANFGVSTSNVVQALNNNNQNAGGGFISHGNQTFNIRGVGKADSIGDLENIIVTQKAGTPIRVKNLGKVMVGAQPRLGKISVSRHMPDGSVKNQDDVVEGVVFSRVGEPDETVLDNLHKKVDELNRNFLPLDVKIKAYLDRAELIHLTTHTVEENMVTGMLLVLIILFFFLGNLRSALIVASVIPLALLFASILLDLNKIPANLLSLGALDFGMVIDGAVVMVENIFRHKQLQKKENAPEDIVALVIRAAKEVERPIVYAIAIIILAYLPIFTLQRVEGRLFSPMAWTVAFALFGALILVLTLVPVFCVIFLKGELKEWHNPVMHWLEVKYRQTLNWALGQRPLIIKIAIGCFVLTIFLAFGGPIGSEFLPHLDEGSLWVRGTLPASASYELAESTINKAREIYMKYPEVPLAVCQLGRPDDGTDATGFFNTECYVDLKPREMWRREFPTKERLVASLSNELAKIPGVVWNFSQPISDNVEEMMSGVKGALVVKVYGDDLKTLSAKATEIKKTLTEIRGVEDLGIFEELGQPNVNIIIDRDKISRYGLNISDVQDVIETAVGGKTASQIISGEKHFDVVVRFQQAYRDNIESIRRILVATPDGYRIPLEEIAEIRIEEGASMIYREKNSRYIAVKFSVRGRDLGSTIEEAQKVLKKRVLLPAGYRLTWSGEFESQKRAEARLALMVPLTIGAIFLILLFVFGSLKWALIIMADVATARMGGVLALFLTGTNFSVSSGIGFLAVFGVSIQTGVLLVSYINQMRLNGASIRDAGRRRVCAAPPPHHDDGISRYIRALTSCTFSRDRF